MGRYLKYRMWIRMVWLVTGMLACGGLVCFRLTDDYVVELLALTVDFLLVMICYGCAMVDMTCAFFLKLGVMERIYFDAEQERYFWKACALTGVLIFLSFTLFAFLVRIVIPA